MSTDTFEIEALDQPTFTQVGHWVAFRTDLSPTARHLYTVLATFVNQGRRANGDTDVWPSLNLLAVTLGLSKGKSVTPYMDELIQANIVEKTTNTIGGMRSRNTYGIRFNPPPGEKTTTSFVELLEPLKAIAGDSKAMTKVSAETRELIKERRARESGKRTGRPVVPDSGPRSHGSGPTYPRIGDRNKTQGEQDAGRTTRSSSSSAGAPPEQRQGEGSTTKKRMSPEEVIKTRLPEEHVTDDEAKSMADLIDRRGAGGGQTIRSLATWIANRDERELRRDLEAVRLIERSPEVEYTGMENCALHSMKIIGGACSSCMGDIKAGDRTAVREHAEMAGPKYRPDLFRALEMPPGGPEGASSGARARVPDHNFWEHVTDNDLKRLAL